MGSVTVASRAGACFSSWWMVDCVVLLRGWVAMHGWCVVDAIIQGGPVCVSWLSVLRASPGPLQDCYMLATRSSAGQLTCPVSVGPAWPPRGRCCAGCLWVGQCHLQCCHACVANSGALGLPWAVWTAVELIVESIVYRCRQLHPQGSVAVSGTSGCVDSFQCAAAGQRMLAMLMFVWSGLCPSTGGGVAVVNSSLLCCACGTRSAVSSSFFRPLMGLCDWARACSCSIRHVPSLKRPLPSLFSCWVSFFPPSLSVAFQWPSAGCSGTSWGGQETAGAVVFGLVLVLGPCTHCYLRVMPTVWHGRGSQLPLGVAAGLWQMCDLQMGGC